MSDLRPDELEVRLSDRPDPLMQRARSMAGRYHLLTRTSILELARDALRREEERDALHAARAGRDVCWVEPDGESEPLVTVRITTYRRAGALMDLTLPSVLGQTYERLEVLVVGDGTDDDTGDRIRSLRDPRVRFINLPYRAHYPRRPQDRWRVSGYAALNASLDLARGAWIAPCDDDDEFTPHHVAALLERAKQERAELVHSNTGLLLGGGVVGVIGRPEPEDGHLSHGSFIYSAGLRAIRYSGSCWKLRRGIEYDLVLRMRRAGVRMAYLDDVTYRYHVAETSIALWREQVLRRRPDLRARFS